MSLTMNLNATSETFLIWVLLEILKLVDPCNGQHLGHGHLLHPSSLSDLL